MNIIRRIKGALVHYYWELAYFDYSNDLLTQGIDFTKIHIVKNPYTTKWFADPFILRNTELELTLLVEEFDYRVNRGRIAQIVIDKTKDVIVSCDIVLDLPTHLSFPVIYRDIDKIYVHPENSASGASYMYEYDESSKEMKNPIKVLDEPLTDAIIVKEDNLFKMYATKLPNPNGSILGSYVSEALVGPYIKSAEYEFPRCRARMAGHFLKKDGKIVRPAQDCEGAYGKAVVFYDGLSELGEIRPSSFKYAGVHTFNRLDNICIVDIKCFDHPLIVSFKNFIKNLKCPHK